MDSISKITLTERKSLRLPFNLADAQNYVSLTEKQMQVISQLPILFDEAQQTPYEVINRRFGHALFNMLGQKAALAAPNIFMYCYSATIALEIATSYLRQRNTTARPVGLLHPTFDTLAYVLKRHGLNCAPIEQKVLVEEDYLWASNYAAIYLTLPNNPTGFTLGREQFRRLAQQCAASNTLLVLDCCYRYYSQENFDFYTELLAAKVDYVVVEDTGKLFPLVDLKLGVLSCNERIRDEVESIHSDFLLEVSKFTMIVIAKFCESQTIADKEKYLWKIKENRVQLNSRLSTYGLRPIGGESINVQLLSLPSSLDSTAFQADLLKNGVGVVDAKRLYWNREESYQGGIRIALSRNSDYFQDALNVIEDVLKKVVRI